MCGYIEKIDAELVGIVIVLRYLFLSNSLRSNLIFKFLIIMSEFIIK